MPGAVRSSWFGRELSVLLVSGKWVSGELTEVTDHYIVLSSDGGDTQIMVHAMVVVRLAGNDPQK